MCLAVEKLEYYSNMFHSLLDTYFSVPLASDNVFGTLSRFCDFFGVMLESLRRTRFGAVLTREGLDSDIKLRNETYIVLEHAPKIGRHIGKTDFSELYIIRG